MEQTQKFAIKLVEDIDCVHNYSKAPIYTQVYIKKGKIMETNLTMRNKVSLPIEKQDSHSD